MEHRLGCQCLSLWCSPWHWSVADLVHTGLCDECRVWISEIGSGTIFSVIPCDARLHQSCSILSWHLLSTWLVVSPSHLLKTRRCALSVSMLTPGTNQKSTSPNIKRRSNSSHRVSRFTVKRRSNSSHRVRCFTVK